jgi:hypothetical protein
MSLWDVDPATLGVTLASGGFTVSSPISTIDWQPRCSITGTPGNDVITGTPSVPLP